MGSAPMSSSDPAIRGVAQVNALRAFSEPAHIRGVLAASTIECCAKWFARLCVRHAAVWCKSLLAVSLCLFLAFAFAFVVALPWLLLVLLLLHLLRELPFFSSLLLLLLVRHMSHSRRVVNSSRRSRGASFGHRHKEEGNPCVCHK